MSKIHDGIMGLVVADALGVPYEFRARDSFKATGMTGYGTYNQPAGTWSDDSSMTLATIKSISEHGKIVPEDIMTAFAGWYVFGDCTPHGKAFDIGGTTRQAIEKYLIGMPSEYCGGTEFIDNGNGALMRILPLAFIDHTCEDIHTVCGLTHAHDISKEACEIYLKIAKGLLEGKGTWRVVAEACEGASEEFERLEYISNLQRNEIKSSGYVVHTLEAATWCLLNSGSYEECVLKAVNLGEDTDTVAAVAGGLAGILWGYKAIPKKWIKLIARKEWIMGLCDQFELVCRKEEENEEKTIPCRR